MNLVASTIAGAVAGLLAALAKSFVDSRGRVDEALHETRTGLYQELWRATSILPLWPPAAGVTFEDLFRMSEWLRDWYFGSPLEPAGNESRTPGGLYLSRRSRDRYEGAQEALRVRTAGRTGPISDDDYSAVRKALSGLRTQLTNDLLSRRGAPYRVG